MSKSVSSRIAELLVGTLCQYHAEVKLTPVGCDAMLDVRSKKEAKKVSAY
jgi:hypothetical protein